MRRQKLAGRVLGWMMIGMTVWLAGCADSKTPVATPVAEAPRLGPNQVRVKATSLPFIETKVVETTGDAHVVWVPGSLVLKEYFTTHVVSPVPGRVSQLHVLVGDHVRANDPLVILVSADAARIRSDYAQAQSAMALAQQNLRRHTEMVRKGVGVQVDLDLARANYQEAQWKLEAVKKEVDQLGPGHGEVVVLRAPRDGVVLQNDVSQGAFVDRDGGSLLKIGDPSALWVAAEVFESDLASVLVNASSDIEIPALDIQLKGEVKRVSSTVNTTTRRGTVFAEIEQQVSGLRAGMLARVGVHTKRPAGLSVPSNAVLVKEGGRAVVFVQSDNDETLFEARDVTLGQPSFGFIPVLDGLNEGDKVVIKGGLLLDGAANQLM